jgi:hypothetical protein
MTFNRVNNITGWAVCLVACAVYVMTMEATGSFWDCGEFISSTYKMQIPHPPGAPLFVMLGRLFIVGFSGILGNGPEAAARSVNLMSALASGFTILFLFWSITHFARKLVLKPGETATGIQLFSIMSAGIVGALAYTFSDSFWFSAVEGEVYGMSSFFTAIVFWAILKWEHNADNPGADRWLVLIFFLMGLSIGVHLLNLLTIPAIVMVYYFKRFKITPLGTFWAFMVGCAITGFVQKVIIQYTVAGAGKFDIWFVNGLNLPFFSGFIVYFLALTLLVIWALNFRPDTSGKTKMALFFAIFFLLLLFPFISDSGSFAAEAVKFILIASVAGLAGYFLKPAGLDKLKLGLWCFAFMLLGYSSYITTMIRSNADPAVDMYNVDNPNSLVGYLGRDQYGDFPLIYGQVFTAQPEGYDEGEMKYVKGKEKDEKTGQLKDKYIEVGKDTKPRYASEDMMLFPRVWDASNDQGHANFYRDYLGLAEGDKPTMFDNIKFFWNYQLNWMYWRYFFWNFAGKQNDIQGFAQGNVRDGNWITGIPPVDNILVGNQDYMPDSIKHNKAHNTLFALPFVLGLIGLLYQFFQRKKDFLVVGLLFFFTGLAICLYLNQAGNQPRERDYAYVGSFYAFAIWIGLGVLQITEWLQKKLSALPSTAISFAVCMLAVPVLMAQQEWDDHDRSKKVLARDLAKDYLESCAPNAILFTFGDNDTYPLWYAQEVEGIRPDIRVINNSLLGIDWYINQLRYKVNNSDPIDVIWNEQQIQGNNRNYAYINPSKDLSKTAYFDLYNMMKDFVGSDEQNAKVAMQGGESINYFPTRRLKIPVDEKVVRGNGTVNASDTITSEVSFELPQNKNVVLKNELAILNIIAANKWKRPIYFTAPYTGSEMGFGNYLRKDGLTYRLVPVKNNTGNNTDWMLDKLMKKFAFGNANLKGVYPPQHHPFCFWRCCRIPGRSWTQSRSPDPFGQMR